MGSQGDSLSIPHSARLPALAMSELKGTLGGEIAASAVTTARARTSAATS